MPVPLIDYNVREVEYGGVSYDSLNSVASKFNTTPQALKYFNRNSPYYPAIKDLKFGEGLLNPGKMITEWASDQEEPILGDIVFPSAIPILKVPETLSGSSSSNQRTGSVSGTRYNVKVCRRIILKRINSNYKKAIEGRDMPIINKPIFEASQDIDDYLASSEVSALLNWEPLNSNFPRPARLRTDAQINEIDRWFEIFQQHRADDARATHTGVRNTTNTTATPDSKADIKRVLNVMQKIIDLLQDSGDSYGHWWLEIYNIPAVLPGDRNNISSYASIYPSNVRESYGFWPYLGVGNPAKGTDGTMNSINMNPTRFSVNSPNTKFDQYASIDGVKWEVDNAFFVTDAYGRSDDEIIRDIREYITFYMQPQNIKRWAWPDYSETTEHCQTFQKELLAACGLVAAPQIPQNHFPPTNVMGFFKIPRRS